MSLSAPPAFHSELFDEATFLSRLQNGASAVAVFKETLELARTTLDRLYREGHDINELVTGRAWFMDQILKLAW